MRKASEIINAISTWIIIIVSLWLIGVVGALQLDNITDSQAITKAYIGFLIITICWLCTRVSARLKKIDQERRRLSDRYFSIEKEL